MDNGKLPKEIMGNWIWEKSLINAPNSSLLVRKEFLLNSSHSVADFWISANCSYQLFINERLIGLREQLSDNMELTGLYDQSLFIS